MKYTLQLCFGLLALSFSSAQQSGGISDFVGQLTNFFNQNGGIGNIANALQQPSPQGGSDNGFGLYQRPGGPPTLSGPGPQSYVPHQQYNEGPYPNHPGFLNALSSISRYDELKCVPRLLCEVASGGKPGYAASSQSLVQSTNKDTLISLLTVLNFIDESPLLIFGRAALIGYTARGNPRACISAYPTCPSEPDALVDYLNNHNGGFFRFFGGAQPQQPIHPQPSYPNYPGLFDGYGPYGSRYPVQHHKRRYPYPYAAYENGPDYQDAAYRPEDPYSAYNYAGATKYYQERIQNRPYPVLSIKDYESPISYQTYDDNQQPTKSNDKLVFPGRTGKTLTFPKDDGQFSSLSNSNFFPDRTGTGKLLLDSQGVHYYNGPPDLINFRDQRSIKFPSSMTFPAV